MCNDVVIYQKSSYFSFQNIQRFLNLLFYAYDYDPQIIKFVKYFYCHSFPG